MQSEKKTQALQSIIKELTEIKDQRETKTLRIAELLAVVNTERLYTDVYHTFAKFVEFIGYSRSYAYDLIKINANDVVRSAFSEIGALSAREIARKASRLDDSVVVDLVEYAKEHKTGKVKTAIKAAIDAKTITPEVETDPLKVALARQTQLLKVKQALEFSLANTIKKLKVLDKEIATLSK